MVNVLSRPVEKESSQLRETKSSISEETSSLPERDSLLKGIAAGSDEEAILDLEFGRTVMPAEQVSRLNGGSIIPLPGNPNGNVQIIWDKRTIAEGTLMIFEGKLAIHINRMNND